MTTDQQLTRGAFNMVRQVLQEYEERRRAEEIGAREYRGGPDQDSRLKIYAAPILARC